MKKKLFISLILAFIFAQIINKEVFFANTPRINPLFIAKIINSPQSFMAMIKNPDEEKKYKPLFKGVYAEETNDNSIKIKITDSNIQMTSQKMTLPNGTVVTLYKPILEKYNN